MLAWMETHVVTLPDGRKVLHVFEVQSDVRQSFTVKSQRGTKTHEEFTATWIDEKGHHQDRGFTTKQEARAFVDKKFEEYSAKIQPLIKYTDELLMKGVMRVAMKEGLDGIVISDSRTAMLTQGHLGEIAPGPLKTTISEKTGELIPAGTLRYFPPSQAAGMTQAYDKSLPNIARKLTNRPGEPVVMGPEKHYALDEIYHDIEEGAYEGFNEAFPGSDSPSGTFFPVQELPSKPFEMFTPKMAELPKSQVEAIEATINCLLQKMM